MYHVFRITKLHKKQTLQVFLSRDVVSRKRRRDIQVVCCDSIMKRRMRLHLFLYFQVYVLCVSFHVCAGVCMYECISMVL